MRHLNSTDVTRSWGGNNGHRGKCGPFFDKPAGKCRRSARSQVSHDEYTVRCFIPTRDASLVIDPNDPTILREPDGLPVLDISGNPLRLGRNGKPRQSEHCRGQWVLFRPIIRERKSHLRKSVNNACNIIMGRGRNADASLSLADRPASATRSRGQIAREWPRGTEIFNAPMYYLPQYAWAKNLMPPGTPLPSTLGEIAANPDLTFQQNTVMRVAFVVMRIPGKTDSNHPMHRYLAPEQYGSQFATSTVPIAYVIFKQPASAAVEDTFNVSYVEVENTMTSSARTNIFHERRHDLPLPDALERIAQLTDLRSKADNPTSVVSCVVLYFPTDGGVTTGNAQITQCVKILQHVCKIRQDTTNLMCSMFEDMRCAGHQYVMSGNDFRVYDHMAPAHIETADMRSTNQVVSGHFPTALFDVTAFTKKVGNMPPTSFPSVSHLIMYLRRGDTLIDGTVSPNDEYATFLVSPSGGFVGTSMWNLKLSWMAAEAFRKLAAEFCIERRLPVKDMAEWRRRTPTRRIPKDPNSMGIISMSTGRCALNNDAYLAEAFGLITRESQSRLSQLPMTKIWEVDSNETPEQLVARVRDIVRAGNDAGTDFNGLVSLVDSVDCRNDVKHNDRLCRLLALLRYSSV